MPPKKDDKKEGSRDIKSSLRQAKLPNGSPLLLDDEQNSLALLIEQARYELNCGSPLVAQGYLDQAMRIDDDEPLVRIERGVCKVRQSLSLEALENVDPVLLENPRHPLALHVKADALYHLGDFEHALVYYHRGLRYSTQDPEIFRLGIRRAVKAIKNAIGPKVTRYFDTMAPVVEEVPQHVLAQPPHMISSFTPDEKKSMPKEASSSKPFLGNMYKEQQYLKRLQHTAKQVGLVKVAKEANTGLKFFDTREEFWRQHTPLYVQKTELKEKFNQSVTLRTP